MLLYALREKARRHSINRLARYEPYERQKEFHRAGASYRERLFMAGNQLGKTWAGAFEMAAHLTGKYPDWWEGRRWARPTRMWGASETMEVSRDGMQRLLLGPPEARGTGAIPGDDIIDLAPYPNVKDAIAVATVRSRYGGASRITFKSYDQGRRKFQADTIDGVWFDEEPPEDVYTEGLTRTNATKGIVYTTFTPLLGMSEVVGRFLTEKNESRVVIVMTIYDVKHYTEEERAAIIASYPEHERDARTKGVPTLGSGRVFPIAEDRIKVEPFAIPDLWPRICGIDFGWDHPTAAVWLAFDNDTDTTYVYDCYAAREGTPDVHAGPILQRGDWIPVSWPHDGLQTEKGSGIQLADQYRDVGLNMIHEIAQFEDVPTEGAEKSRVSRTSVEAGVTLMLREMQAGKFKVFSNLEDWFQEFRLYHREDGKIVKRLDDRMSATRYARVMRRYASTPPMPHAHRIDPDRPYDWRVG